MNITVKDIPPELHARLREVAGRTGRSLNKMILYTLDQSVSPSVVDQGELGNRIRRRRERMDVWLEDGVLQSAIRDGRP